MYLDASALLKLLVTEPESEALADFLASRTERFTSRLAAVEVPRALLRGRMLAQADQSTLWSSISFRELDDEVIRRAATLEPAAVRALDAIHIASALLVASELESFVTYDARMADAARTHGLPVVAPS